MARPGASTSFSAFASRLLANPLSPTTTTGDSQVPLFYSTVDGEVGLTRSDDILGAEDRVEPWETSNRFRAGRPRSDRSDSDVLGSTMQTEEGDDPFLGQDGLVDQDPFSHEPKLAQSRGRDSLGGSTGWKIHQTTTFQPGEVYREPTEYSESSSRFIGGHSNNHHPSRLRPDGSPFRPPSDLEQSLASSSPPSPRKPRFQHTFFRSSEAPPPSSSETLQTPLLAPPAPYFLYPRPSTSLAHGAPHRRRDPAWLISYQLCVMCTAAVALWTAFEPPPLPSTFVQALPLLTFLSFVALLAGTSATTYLVIFGRGVRLFVYASLAAPPVFLVLGAGWAFSSSWGIERVASAKALRWSCVVALAMAAVLASSAWKRRGRIDRTANVLEVRT
jgi:hypothetical protein